MAATLTQETLAERQEQIETELDRARRTYQKASLAAETGTGTEEERRAAKEKVDALEERLSALHVAYQQAQSDKAKRADDARKSGYNRLVRDVETELAHREKSITEIESAAAALAAAINGYSDAEARIRQLATEYRSAHGAPIGMPQAIQNATRSSWSVGSIVAAILKDAGVQPTSISGDYRLSTRGTPTELVQRSNGNVRAHLSHYAPEG